MVENTIEPKFAHDCASCVFLGRYVDTNKTEVDLYAHGGEGILRTVIARFGSAGPDYSSGLPFSYGLSSALTEARLRAQEKGLFEYDWKQALHYAKAGSAQHKELTAHLVKTHEYMAYEKFVAGDGSYKDEIELLLQDSELYAKILSKEERSKGLVELEMNIYKVANGVDSTKSKERFDVIGRMISTWDAKSNVKSAMSVKI